MTLNPAFRTHPWIMWVGLALACLPFAAFLVFALITVPAEYLPGLALYGIPVVATVVAALLAPSVGGWLFLIGGGLVAAFVGFGMLVAVADISVGSGMTLADWVQILGVMVAALLIPIGGVVLLVGKRRHDRAMAAYAVNEGPTTVLTPDVVDQLNDLLALRENGEISAEEHERRANQII